MPIPVDDIVILFVPLIEKPKDVLVGANIPFPLALDDVGSNLAPVTVLLKVLAPFTVCVLIVSTKVLTLAPVPPFATGKIPVTPLVNGNPVALVKTPLVGVPKALPLR